MADDKKPEGCVFRFTLAQQMTALGCMDCSWHDHEHEQMKDLLCRGAAKIEELAAERDKATVEVLRLQVLNTKQAEKLHNCRQALDDARAKAWEEGYQSAWVDGADRTSEHFVPNPYRIK